jgi:hypothetical protein
MYFPYGVGVAGNINDDPGLSLNVSAVNTILKYFPYVQGPVEITFLHFWSF